MFFHCSLTDRGVPADAWHVKQAPQKQEFPQDDGFILNIKSYIFIISASLNV